MRRARAARRRGLALALSFSAFIAARISSFGAIQQAVVESVCEGISTGPMPMFSRVLNLIFLKATVSPVCAACRAEAPRFALCWIRTAVPCERMIA